MSIDRVRSHFGLSRAPFSKELAPSMLFNSTTHAQAVARINYLVAERGLGLVTGEVGSGKTVAARAALSLLDSSRHSVIYLANPAVGTRGMYGAIVSGLGGVPRFHKAALIPQAAAALAAEEAEWGRKVIVVLDEAHLLEEGLEELRLLMASEMDSRAAFCCLLLGQPTLRRRVRLGTLAALNQRITLRYHLEGMDQAETAAYIAHHLKLCGRVDPVFSEDATALIHQVARGLPRAVNNLATQALVAACASSKSIVDESSARAAVAELDAE
ncbi:MAG TPA: AAA family ATPase [Myxococcales bacterium]|nr:AAA family ATPase [Myxococcales bacterium]